MEVNITQWVKCKRGLACSPLISDQEVFSDAKAPKSSEKKPVLYNNIKTKIRYKHVSLFLDIQKDTRNLSFLVKELIFRQNVIILPILFKPLLL